MHSGGRFQTCPHPPPWRAAAPNDGFHPRTAPCGPAARAPRRNAHPFTRCCRADHTRHRMHRGGRFQTCPHYGVLMHQTMGSTRAPHHAGQLPSLPSEMCTRSPVVVLPIIPVTACIEVAGFKPAPIPHHGVLMRQTMGSTRASHHAGQRPALPSEMCTRSPAVASPIIPVTACIVGAGLKPALTPHHGVLIRQTMGSTRALHHTGQRPAHCCPPTPRITTPHRNDALPGSLM